MSDPQHQPDDFLKAYVRIFKQLSPTAAAELLMVMANDRDFPATAQIKQAALLAVAGNKLFAGEEGKPNV